MKHLLKPVFIFTVFFAFQLQRLCAQIVQLSPTEVYINSAIIKENNGDYKAAIEDCNKALSRDSLSAMAYVVRGKAYHDLELDKEAMADYNKAIAIAPHNASFYLNRGDAYKKMKLYNEAIVDYN